MRREGGKRGGRINGKGIKGRGGYKERERGREGQRRR